MPRSPASNRARPAKATIKGAPPVPAARGWHMVDTTTTRKAVEFYSIELAQLANGTFHVSLTATTVDEEEAQLLCQEMTSERVASIDNALAVIKEGVVRTS